MNKTVKRAKIPKQIKGEGPAQIKGILFCCAICIAASVAIIFALSLVISGFDDPERFIFPAALFSALVAGLLQGAFIVRKCGNAYLCALISALAVVLIYFLLSLFFDKSEIIYSYQDKLILLAVYFLSPVLGVRLFAKKPKRRIKR